MGFVERCGWSKKKKKKTPRDDRTGDRLRQQKGACARGPPAAVDRGHRRHIVLRSVRGGADNGSRTYRSLVLTCAHGLSSAVRGAVVVVPANGLHARDLLSPMHVFMTPSAVPAGRPPFAARVLRSTEDAAVQVRALQARE
jgi:hypothetical protein